MGNRTTMIPAYLWPLSTIKQMVLGGSERKTMDQESRQRQARLLRKVRVIHRWTGVTLFLFVAWVGLTGGLLGWKKNSGGLILAPTAQGSSSELATWLPVDSLRMLAIGYLRDSVDEKLTANIDRMEIRPDKGVVKFTFKKHYWGLQVDGANGQLLRVERRNADIIEQLHDASFIDVQLGLDGNPVKLVFTSVMSLALICFSLSGFWLWYGPRRMRTTH